MARDYGPRPFLGRDWYKAHALGNDYLVFEESVGWRAAPAAVARVCHCHEGVGGDGIVVLLELPRGRPATGYALRMFNPDGSEFERSGNGLRVLAAYLHRRGLVGDGPFEVSCGGDSMRMQVHSHTAAGSYDVEVEMGRARIGPDAVGLDALALDPDGRLAHPLTGPVALVPVGIGNPHAVLFADALAVELAPATLERLGPGVAMHPALAHGANVQLARAAPPAALDILIWERGGRTHHGLRHERLRHRRGRRRHRQAGAGEDRGENARRERPGAGEPRAGRRAARTGAGGGDRPARGGVRAYAPRRAG